MLLSIAVGLLCIVGAIDAKSGVTYRSVYERKVEKRWPLGYGRNGQPLPDLFTATLEDLTGGLANGTFTSVDLVTAYIQRINETQPILRSVLEINPYALSEASAADAQRAAGNSSGLLFGIPILVKDNIATARPTPDTMNTTAGSFALLGSVPPGDSTIAAKLKAAGAIILGKSNLSQWANYRSTNSTNGWTSRGNQTTAAYYPNLDPSGSSSGPGVDSSIGLAWNAIGTETSGSIISPSQRNNLCGIKPTVGLTSRYLVIPISANQDTIGPMSRTCRDAAALLSVIAGFDPNDNYTSAIPFDTLPDYVGACKTTALQGAKIGVPSSFVVPNASLPSIVEYQAFNNSLPIIKSLGASVQLNTNFPALAEYRNSTNSSIVLNIDFIAGIATYFGALTSNPTGITDLRGLLNFTQTDPREDWPDRNTVTWEQALARNLTQQSPAYIAALQADLYLGGNGTILGALDNYGLDALVVPSSLAPGVAAIAGYPIVTVPLGFYPVNTTVVMNSRGTLVSTGPHVPFGLSWIGRRFSEEKLIGYAYAFEQATHVRDSVDPYFLPNFQLIDALDASRTLQVTSPA